jgi:hypothetical protein
MALMAGLVHNQRSTLAASSARLSAECSGSLRQAGSRPLGLRQSGAEFRRMLPVLPRERRRRGFPVLSLAATIRPRRGK